MMLPEIIWFRYWCPFPWFDCFICQLSENKVGPLPYHNKQTALQCTCNRTETTISRLAVFNLAPTCPPPPVVTNVGGADNAGLNSSVFQEHF